MVDKENQWDKDMEYSQDNSEYNDYGESDYSNDNDDYSGQYDDSYDEYDEDESSNKNKSQNKLPLIIIALLLLGIAGVLMLMKINANRENDTQSEYSNHLAIEQTEDNLGSSEEETADMFFDQASGNSDELMSFDFSENGDVLVSSSDKNGETSATVATVTDTNTSLSEEDLFGSSDELIVNDTSKENNDIIISYDKVARENPFKPPVYEQVKSSLPTNIEDNTVVINNTRFEVIEPPTKSVPDDNLTRLLSTQISGILYDEKSPSAIVNLNGVDSFVKVGDVISGYKIQSITQDKVQISYKNNTYVASVGELFVKGQLEKQNAVANLEKKFAGRYKDNN